MRLSVQGSGPPDVLVLPGLAGGTGLFRLRIDAAASLARVLAFDPVGEWRGERREQFTFDSYAGEIEAALDAARSPRAVVWGNSFGALLAISFQHRRPGRVAGLILNGLPVPPPFPALVGLVGSVAGDEPGPWLHALFRAVFVPAVAWEMVRPGGGRESLRLARAARAAATPSRTLAGKLRLLYDPAVGEEVRLRPGLPTLLVRGRWDPLAPRRGAQDLVAASPSAALVEIPRAGHAATSSAPSRFDAAVASFLARWRVR